MKGLIAAVSTSRRKGIVKTNIAEGVLKEGYGLEGDAHADVGSHRQVSLLAVESIDKMRQPGVDISMGDFAENLTTQGIDLLSLPVGTRLHVGEDVVLELTQIGKECHSGCAIARRVGRCVMPTEGIFARVVKGGRVRPGNVITALEGNDRWIERTLL